VIAWPDAVNGVYEFMGAPFILMSILKLHRDKRVRGVSWIHVAFFSSWGYWNLFYYPHLNQWCSFFGGVCLVLANTFWLGQIIYYIYRERNK
jgi:hypothetical protein